MSEIGSIDAADFEPATAASRIRISIADMIYILDIQRKHTEVDLVMERNGIDEGSFERVKAALRKGRWSVP